MDGLAVRVYANDHRPARVHVVGKGCEAVFILRAGAPELRENYGFGPCDVKRIEAGLSERMDEILAAWERIHGPA